MKTKCLLLLCLLFSCRKSGKESPPDNIAGRWICVKIRTHVNYHVVPYPHLSSEYETVEVPDKAYVLNIGHDGILKLSVNDAILMEEDFFTDLVSENLYRIHYYGTRKSRHTQYFDVSMLDDTLIINNFFPYTSSYTNHGGGHGGSNSTANRTNYFVRQ